MVDGAGLLLFTAAAIDASFRIQFAKLLNVWSACDTLEPKDEQKRIFSMGNHFRRPTSPVNWLDFGVHHDVNSWCV